MDRILEDKDNYFEGFKIYTSTIVKTALPIPDKNCDAKTETAVDAISLAAQVWHDSYI